MRPIFNKLLSVLFPGISSEADHFLIVPAQPGTQYIGFGLVQEIGYRFLMSEIHRPCTVIAWRVFADGTAVPVLAFWTVEDTDNHAIVFPDGRVETKLIYPCEFESVAKFMEAAERYAQSKRRPEVIKEWRTRSAKRLQRRTQIA